MTEEKFNLIEIIQMAKGEDEFYFNAGLGDNYRIKNGKIETEDGRCWCVVVRWSHALNEKVFTLPKPEPKKYKMYRHWYVCGGYMYKIGWGCNTWDKYSCSENELIHTETIEVSSEGVRRL